MVQNLPNVCAFMPHICVHNISATGGSGICCPAPAGYTETCGGNGIGKCSQVYIQADQLPAPELSLDDRMNWPERFFRRMCRCEGNRFGIACEQCWFGWKGQNCDEPERLIRRNIMSFSRRELEMFVDVVKQMPNTPTEYMVLFEADSLHSDPLYKPTWIPANLHY
ncbi:unnamed protein product, partial [Protopolystoma xenopodis]